VLREKFDKKRILLNDDQRRRLAVKGKTLGRRMLEQMATIVTPDTILRWHRELIAAKWNYSHCRNKIGRLPVSAEVVELVLRMACENASWGYDRIHGALENLGHLISDKSVGNILKAHGIEPAPDRKRQSTWKTFLHAHWDVLASVDFTTIEVWTKSGLITIYLLYFMELATRKVHFAGSTANPDEPWMLQIARNGNFAFSASRIRSTLHLKSSETGPQFQLKAEQKCAFDRRLKNFTIRGENIP
jgi:putative transposase